jgi:UDP-hydrolysing UDP-N-acetyl-D-glucosamine 2-epimerase
MSPRRKIAVVTGGRADYGLLYWVMRDIQAAPDLELQLLATGAHLEEAFGRTLGEIHADGFSPSAEVRVLEPCDGREAVARAISRGVAGFAEALCRLRPDVVLLMADRYEVFAAAVAAVTLGVPVAHLSGGEATEGLFDDDLRHAITKMSRIHFPSMEFYRQRLIRMGEAPSRVFTVGEPGLDHCRRTPLMDAPELSNEVGLDFARPVALVTFHPVTLELDRTAEYVGELLEALDRLPELQVLLTYPGADPSARTIIAAFEDYAPRRKGAALHKSLGSRRYLSVLRHAKLMIGNSSSGIVEAPSFELPAVNVGSRQRGRVRAANVIDVDCTADAITSGARRALEPSFREGLRGLENPYGDGDASRRIVEVLRGVDLGSLRYKPFHDAREGG